jgi:signal transduction histidine kinase
MKKIAVFGLVFIFAAVVNLYAENFTRDDAVNLTEKAVELILLKGIDNSRDMLHDQSGEYIKGGGELYVSVVDFNGVWLAYAPRPKGVGKSVLNVKDPDGVYLVQELIKTAKEKGSGWVKYRWLNPKSGKIENKEAYVKRVGNLDMYASVGIYK